MSLKTKIIFLLATVSCWHIPANAADLIDVYQQALISDPVYQQAINQQLSTNEGLPISISQVLPNISLNYNPSVTRQGFSGANVDGTAVSPRNNTQRAYALTLSLSQTVFNFAQFANIQGALATARGADATLNAALQDLMIRTAKAYFAILQDEDNLNYTEASTLAYREQLDQAKQQFKVGLKTITDVYTAQAAYDSAVADFIEAQTTLANDRENLRAITGKYYGHLSALSEDFPLVTPKPRQVDAWVQKAQEQNWTIKASQYTTTAALATVKEQYGGHLPTAVLQGTMDRQYQLNINGYPNTVDQREGPSTQTDRGIALNLTLPIFEGGGVVASTNQAIYNYKAAQQQLEKTLRSTINTTRQSYQNIISAISQLSADKQAIKSNVSALDGMETSYRVGTETLVNVLNQQQKLFQAQTQYAADRYAFVNNILLLKQAAGTLGFDDLRGLNHWLINKPVSEKPRQLKRMIFSRNDHPKKNNLGVKKVAVAKQLRTTKKLAKHTQKMHGKMHRTAVALKKPHSTKRLHS